MDSTVCARLLGEVLGPGQLHLLHIDNGLMRKDESRQVLDEFERAGLGRNLHFVDASDRFLAALDGVIEPEQKRSVIGTTFVRVFEDEVRRLDLGEMLLAQGTIYPDTIETGGTRRADTIKTHHNRVPIIEEMIRAGRVVEPLRDLYKVEVREMAEALGHRAVARLAASVPRPRARRSPAVLRRPRAGRTRRRNGSSRSSTNSCGHGPPGPAAARALGRRQGGSAHLRAAGDADRAGAARHAAVGRGADLRPHPGRESLRARPVRTRHPPRANRAPPAMTRARLDLLREADAIVMRAVERHGLMRAIWQFPTVMLPLAIDGRGEELVILRPVLSERGMTARPAALPHALVDDIREPILSLPGVSGLVLDLTTKPPGTIEWE